MKYSIERMKMVWI